MMHGGEDMRIDTYTDPDDAIAEIAARFKQYRIAYPMTQAELAERSMVSLSTIRRFESGEDICLARLLALMDALGLRNRIDILVPDQSVRPSAYLEKDKPRRRAGRRTVKREWTWGDGE